MFENALLSLDSRRRVTAGSPKALRDAIRRGGDLRIYTGFKHNEHIDVHSDNPELIHEISDFRVTWLLDDRWVAGAMNLRMPVVPPGIFGPRPSWSFFLYNEDGSQAIARPFLDGQTRVPPTGEFPAVSPADMPKYHTLSDFDQGTNAPSQNFVYDFEAYHFFVNDCWEEIYAHDAQGNPLLGSYDDLTSAFLANRELKAAIRDFGRAPGEPTCELFTHLGSGYQNTETRNFCINSQPVVVVQPAIPLRYASGNWSFGNMILRSNGEVTYWKCDPYLMQYSKVTCRCPIRYFARR